MMEAPSLEDTRAFCAMCQPRHLHVRTSNRLQKFHRVCNCFVLWKILSIHESIQKDVHNVVFLSFGSSATAVQKV
jgi:hypothetical protein